MEQESRQNLRARVSWPVAIQTEEGTIERVTYNISTQAPPDEDMPRGMGVEFIKISNKDREMITSFVTEYLESTSSDEDEEEESLIEEKLVKEELAGDEKEDMNTHALDPPKQCPRSHKHISWSADEDRIFCWDCNSWYPLAECLGRKDAASSRDAGLEG